MPTLTINGRRVTLKLIYSPVTHRRPFLTATLPEQRARQLRWLGPRFRKPERHTMMLLLNLIQRCRHHNSALMNHRHMVRYPLNFIKQMRRKQRRTSLVGHGSDDGVQDIASHDGVQSARGFVQQQKVRPVRHRGDEAGLRTHSAR